MAKATGKGKRLVDADAGPSYRVEPVDFPPAVQSIPVADRHSLIAIASQLANQFAEGRLEHIEFSAKLKGGEESRWRLG
jgi:hypothetical protein